MRARQGHEKQMHFSCFLTEVKDLKKSNCQDKGGTEDVTLAWRPIAGGYMSISTVEDDNAEDLLGLLIS